MSTVEGSYDHSGYVVWKTTAALYPSHDATQINIGFNGRLVTQPTAMERGYIIDKDNSTILISIPYNAEEAQRKVRKHQHKRSDDSTYLIFKLIH